MRYTPRPDGLAGRVCAFFLTHRDEELEEQDIATKFGCPAGSVRPSLRSSVAMGFLTYGPDETTTNVYRAGPRIGELQEEPAAAAPATPAEVSTGKTKKKSGALPPPEAVLIEPGIPIPAAAPKASDGWRAVFDRMQPGDSFGCSKDNARSLLRRAQIFGKPLNRSFTSRQVDASTSRIWRTE